MPRPPKQTPEDWLRAGFRALVKHGPEGLKAEPLARSINTTKGSFYWYFSDVAAFRAAMLDHWEKRAFSDVVDFLRDEPTVPMRLRKLGKIVANAAGEEFGGAQVEPAIRAWARSDPAVGQAVQNVDAQRLGYLNELLAELGITNPDFARLIYASLIGLEDLSSRDGQPNQRPLGTLIDLILALE